MRVCRSGSAERPGKVFKVSVFYKLSNLEGKFVDILFKQFMKVSATPTLVLAGVCQIMKGQHSGTQTIKDFWLVLGIAS